MQQVVHNEESQRCNGTGLIRDFNGSGVFGRFLNQDQKKVLLHSINGCFFSGFVSKSISLNARVVHRPTVATWSSNGTVLRYM